MDDIQLCNDIMDLKQELQNLVAIPGNHGDPTSTRQLLRVPVWKALAQPHSCNSVLPIAWLNQLHMRQTSFKS